jgi:hypothetical protein
MAYTTIDNPFKHFNTVTYSGNGSGTQAITGVGYQPDWVWIKSRSNTENHMFLQILLLDLVLCLIQAQDQMPLWVMG